MATLERQPDSMSATTAVDSLSTSSTYAPSGTVPSPFPEQPRGRPSLSNAQRQDSAGEASRSPNGTRRSLSKIGDRIKRAVSQAREGSVGSAGDAERGRRGPESRMSGVTQLLFVLHNAEVVRPYSWISGRISKRSFTFLCTFTTSHSIRISRTRIDRFWSPYLSIPTLSNPNSFFISRSNPLSRWIKQDHDFWTRRSWKSRCIFNRRRSERDQWRRGSRSYSTDQGGSK